MLLYGHNIPRKFLCLLVLNLCLNARVKADVQVQLCPGETFDGQIQKKIVAIDKALQRGTKAHVKLLFEIVTGPLSSPQCDRINELIAKRIFENYTEYFHVGEPLSQIPYTVESVADYIARDYEAVFSSFKEEVESFGTVGPVGVIMLGRINDSIDGFLSYRLQDAFSVGDPYGRPAYYERGLVLDLRTGEPVKIEEIIDKGSWENLERMLAQSFHSQYPESLMDYNSIEPSDNFSFSEQGVVFMYDAGTIDSLAMGVIVLTIPWTDFKQIASESFR